MDNSEFFVNPQGDHNIEAIRRFQSVKRWHMIDTTRQQTIAEHSANVALLAGYIARTSPNGYFGRAEFVVANALIHDLTEVFVGDTPTHTKKRVPEIRDFEHQFNIDPISNIEPSDDIKLLIKICDLADGMRFISLYGIGDVARFALHGLNKQMSVKMEEAATVWPPEEHIHVRRVVTEYAIP